jgi:molybdopterin/thiamine biosynthesis adenylyltransferase
MKKTRKIKVVGAGGIGSYLIEPLARYLSCSEDNCEITVIDGDKFEERNKERQRFVACENKAEHTVTQLKPQFPKITFRSKGEYLTPENIISLIREDDTVMLCVDNHATRKLVSDRCQELKNVTLISGGNEYTDGNVIVYRRENGKDLSRPMTQIHPAINSPEDKNPGVEVNEERSGCEQQTQASPQLLFMNLAIASHMLNCYYASEQNKLNFEQVYVDIATHRSRPSP